MDKWIAVFDIKAFYASFECVERKLDPFVTPLAVTDTSRKESTIVLSVSPYLKSLGVPSRCRRRDLPTNIKGMILATPQMEKYVKCSAKVMSIFLDYVGEDDLHIYSIDEAFLNIGPYLTLNKCGPYELCKRIQKDVKDKTGLIVTCGIGPNMFLAKVADEQEAKNNMDFIALWRKEDIANKLWPIKPLSKLWGISSGYEASLNKLGIYSIYDLAHYDKGILVKKFGVMGEELYNNANGIDDTDIREKYTPQDKNISLGQVLMRDYSLDEIPLIIEEMTDDLAARLRKNRLKATSVALSIVYSSLSTMGGFHHQCKLLKPTDLNSELYEALKHLYITYAEDKPIRQVQISFGGLVKNDYDQGSIFKDFKSEGEERSLYHALDKIQQKFGKNSVLRTSSLEKSSTAKERHNQIGGHRK
jgi:DNA polymerase V